MALGVLNLQRVLSRRQDLGRPSWTFGPNLVWVGQREDKKSNSGMVRVFYVKAVTTDLQYATLFAQSTQ